jgi:hypothetical protein
MFAQCNEARLGLMAGVETQSPVRGGYWSAANEMDS